MNGFKLWLSELKHIGSNKKVLIPFIAVLMIPLIYSGMFLWAFWNPYGSMDQLPVAIVNSDEGAEFNDEPLTVGKEFVDNLEDSGDFKYEVVSKEEGYDGLSNHEYYMLVEIPENFSSSATTILDENPEKLQLKYVPNEGFNFLSAQIGESATEQMKAKLADEMSETYANAMFAQFNELKTGLADASTKAGDLNNGAKDLDSGAKELKEKLRTFSDKQLQFTDGTQELRQGTSEVATGANELNQGLSALQNGYGQIVSGANSSKDGAIQLRNGLSQSKDGAAQLEQGLAQLVQQSGGLEQSSQELSNSLKSLNGGAQQVNQSAATLSEKVGGLKEGLAPVIAQMPEEQQQKILAQLEQLNQGAKQLSGATSQLATGSQQVVEKTASLPNQMASLSEAHSKLQQGATALSAGQNELYNGASALVQGQEKFAAGVQTFNDKLTSANTGAAQLADGAAQVNQGANELFNGSSQLADGSQKLAKGANDLSSGTNELTSGTSEFESNLSEASSKAQDVQTSMKTEEMLAKPVDLDKNSVNEVPNYGTGFTPYFLSLGLFVGALIITIVYPVREPSAAPRNAFSWFFAKFGVLVSAGLIQAVIAASVILYGLGLEVESVPYFYLFSILTSLTFMAMIQVLVTTLGDPGRFIAILILIMQLTTSAGTFPLELIPEPLQIFNPVLPMTYSVEGLKAVISEGDYSLMWQDSSILAIFLLGSVIITIGYFIVAMRKRRLTSVDDAA
ncbi:MULTISPECIES: YhgE/Pip domain-containing protein [Pontibacillus]|uniref:YhgE/Pip domain-containing protein n=1 Tax=Pontibacillus chungwhensis TaxID=265426 RepID=A0ABY8UWH7_9BACI|nr:MULTISPECIES: YhgE/Pip domain-containing protein [Pontibacillus]MCD5325097.1 YhgE/Pip domain-containing protein [Pontibacillus sp. HN14]WIF97347.1 YhgE/Pip domain-containing protein [Pontibacillus chungwhensis]